MVDDKSQAQWKRELEARQKLPGTPKNASRLGAVTYVHLLYYIWTGRSLTPPTLLVAVRAGDLVAT